MTMPAPTLDRSRLNPGRVTASALTRIAGLTQPLKSRIRALLELHPGLAVLDVGCGPGLDAAAVAARVSPGGVVVGLDYDASLIEAARRQPLAPAASAEAPVFAVADATAIPCGDARFDRTFSERVLQHCAAPERVVAEMVRVTRPGGLVLLADTDWGTLSIDTADVSAAPAERALTRYVGDTLRNGYSGRQLRRLLLAQQLVDVEVEVWPVVWTDYVTFRATSLAVLDMDARAVRDGALPAEALAQLQTTFENAEAGGSFFASAAIMIARGRKPATAGRV